jgi:putative peptidoglycan lipid II flippase
LIADSRLRRRLPRLALAALIMGATLFGLDKLIAPYTTGPLLIRFIALAGLVGGGISIYGLACFLTGAYRIADLKALIGRRGDAAQAPRDEV